MTNADTRGACPAWAALPQPTRIMLHGAPLRLDAVRIITSSDALVREADRLTDDLRALGIAVRADAPVTIELAIASGPAEGYEIEIGDDIGIRAPDPAGAFYATRQLLQNLRHRGSVPRGRVASAPAVAERGVHLDAARASYPAAWIAALLRRGAEAGLNRFQWHFSENEGLRLAVPGLDTAVSSEHITADETRQLLALAADLHVTVVPSFDMPGHLAQVLRTAPELRLPGEDGALDIASLAAVSAAKEWLDSSLSLFPDVTEWNLGADEFVDFTRVQDYPTLARAAHERFGADGTGFDLLTSFVIDMAEHLARSGKRTRVWNDGMFRSAHQTLPADVEITWWTNWHRDMAPLSDALSAGHGVLNFHDALLYYVLGEREGYLHPTAERLWEAGWHPGLFPALPDGTAQELHRPYPPQLRGAYASIWSDAPADESPREVFERTASPFAAFAERAWNAGSTLTLAQLTALVERPVEAG